MAELAERLGDRVDDETRELIGVARRGADFAASADDSERRREGPADPLERASAAPESKRREIEANLPGLVGLVNEPGFVLK